MKKMKPIHLVSIIAGLIAVIYGIVMSVIKGSFQEYFELVFVGAVLVSLGLLNKHLR